MASYLPTTGWLYNPVEISIDLDQLHSLGELPDEGQSGAEGVDPEAFVVPDGCFTGRAWGYSRLGGRVVGRVVVRAVQPGSRVWYEGLQLRLQQYMHLMDPYIQSEQITVTILLVPTGVGAWVSDVPTSFPFSLPLTESSGWADTYNGCSFAIRHMLTAVLQRPWYTFDCSAHAVLWLYSIGPGHESTTSREAAVSVADIHDVTQSDQIAAVAAVPLEASVLVPSRGAAEAQAVGGVAAALVCTQCTMSMQSDHMPCNGSLECSLSFRGVTVLLSASRGCAGDVKPWAPTATDPFVDVMLVQLVLIKGEFSADCCMHMKTVLVHTVIGFGDSTNEELMETTALSRGYTSRRCVSIEPQSKCTCLMSQFYRGMSYSTTSGSIVREQDPITEDTTVTVMIPLGYVSSRDRTRQKSAIVQDKYIPKEAVVKPNLTSEDKSNLAHQEGSNSLTGYQFLGNPCMWQGMRVDPSFRIQKIQSMRVPTRNTGDSSSISVEGKDFIPADPNVLENEVAVRYFLRLIVQDRAGETYFVTSKEVLMYRESSPEVIRIDETRTNLNNSSNISEQHYSNENAINL